MKRILLILIFSLIFLLFYLAFPYLIGGDVYYFYGISCDYITNVSEVPILSLIFFQNFPCSHIGFKLLSFIMILISSLIVAKTGGLFDKKYGWMAGLFVFSSVSWIQFFVQIEDDILGFPILLTANYFFLKGQIEKNNGWKLLSIALILFTGLFVWRGAYVFLVAYSFFFIIALILFIISFAFIGFGAISQFLPGRIVIENNPAILTLGLGHGGAIFGVFGLIRGKVWLAIPFLIMGFLKLKFAIYAAPFLAIGLVFILKWWLERPKEKMQQLPKWFRNPVIGMSIFTVALMLGTSFGLLLQMPYSNQVEAIEFAIEESERTDLKLMNDWSYGYWIRYFGATPSFEGHGYALHNFDSNTIVLTEFDQNCLLLKNFGRTVVRELRVYRC